VSLAAYAFVLVSPLPLGLRTWLTGILLFVAAPLAVGVVTVWASKGKLRWYHGGVMGCQPALWAFIIWLAVPSGRDGNVVQEIRMFLNTGIAFGIACLGGSIASPFRRLPSLSGPVLSGLGMFFRVLVALGIWGLMLACCGVLVKALGGGAWQWRITIYSLLWFGLAGLLGVLWGLFTYPSRTLSRPIWAGAIAAVTSLLLILVGLQTTGSWKIAPVISALAIVVFVAGPAAAAGLTARMSRRIAERLY